MIDIVPAMVQLRKGLKLKDSKENIVYRLVFDVLGSFLKANDGPQFKVYTQKFLPLVIEFYKGLTDEEVSELNEIMKEITSPDICIN